MYYRHCHEVFVLIIYLQKTWWKSAWLITIKNFCFPKSKVTVILYELVCLSGHYLTKLQPRCQVSLTVQTTTNKQNNNFKMSYTAWFLAWYSFTLSSGCSTVRELNWSLISSVNHSPICNLWYWTYMYHVRQEYYNS